MCEFKIITGSKAKPWVGKLVQFPNDMNVFHVLSFQSATFTVTQMTGIELGVTSERTTQPYEFTGKIILSNYPIE